MACECLKGCPFFNDRMAEKPALAALYKRNYCEGCADGCARYMVRQSLGPTAVPGDLMPNQADRARQIIAAAAHQ